MLITSLAPVCLLAETLEKLAQALCLSIEASKSESRASSPDLRTCVSGFTASSSEFEALKSEFEA